MKPLNLLATSALLTATPALAQNPFFAGDTIPDTQIEISVPSGPTGKAQFLINGSPTYSGLGLPSQSEGLLQNIRWVQATIHDTDSHPAPPPNNIHPDWINLNSTGWDPQENTMDFIHAMDEWKAHGIRAFTLNLQGGCQCAKGIYGDDQDAHANGLINNPLGASGTQCFDDWDNGMTATEEYKYLRRLGSFIQAADDRGMVVILGIFYFGQDQLITAGEPGIIAAVERTVKWVIENDFTNVLLEIGNESNHYAYDWDILKPARVTELVDLVHDLTDPVTSTPSIHSAGFATNPGWSRPQPHDHMLVSVSGTGAGGSATFGFPPTPTWIDKCDFILLHANNMLPANIGPFVDQTRTNINAVHGNPYKLPVIFNEDDGRNNTALAEKVPNMIEAYDKEASWGLYWDTYHQSPPFDPRISEGPSADVQVMARAFAATLGINVFGVEKCAPAVANSSGSWGHIYATDSDVATDNSMQLVATGLPQNSYSMFVVGSTFQISNPANSQGPLCVGGNLGRYQSQIQNSGKDGCISIDASIAPLPTSSSGHTVVAGETWLFQAWHRDVVQGTVTSNYTNAIEVLFQ